MSAPRTTFRCILFAWGIGAVAIVGVLDVAASPAGVSANAALAPSPVSAATHTTHTVLRGQTLFSIARSYGVPVRSLAAANGIRNPSRLRAGARLVIPASGSRPRSRPARPAVKTPPAAPVPQQAASAAGDEEDELP